MSESLKVKIRTWLLFSMVFLLPFKIKGAALLPAVYLIVWLTTGGYRHNKATPARHWSVVLLLAFYLFHVLGMLWSLNTNDGLFDLQVKFSLLFFPLLFIFSPGFDRNILKNLLRWFLAGNAIALLACLARAVLNDKPDSFFYVTFSWFMHPGYFSMYLCFSVALILYDIVQNKSGNLFPRDLSIFLVALFVTGVVLLSSKTGLFLIVCILGWFVYRQFLSGSGRRAAYLIIGLLVGVIVLSETTPIIHDRIYEVRLAFSSNPRESDPQSSVMRMQVWNSAMAIIANHPLIGTGTGDIKDELIRYYRDHGYNRIADTELNAHNQFLQTFATLGITGILLLVGFLISGFRQAISKRNGMLFWLLLIFIVFSLFESVLEVQAGVMFLGLFFPLLLQWKPEPVAEPAKTVKEQQSILTILRTYAAAHPLRFALAAGFVIRCIAVIFSRGFGMHDDHFLVIEASGAWVDGTDYDAWLPAHGGVKPDGHSFFYSGMHFIFFHLLKFLGVYDPQYKMFFVRLAHAVLSLGTIYFGFRIAYKLGDLKSASTVGILLALIWFMPWLSVRNLVEVACIPFLLYGAWLMVSAADKEKPHNYFLFAGMLFGIAFSIRFQTVLFIGGAGLALLFMKQLRNAIYLGIGTLIIFTATQAPVDYIIWGAPFAQFAEYIRYNLDNAYSYIVGPWYNYSLLILGILVPPVSFFLIFGWFKNWKKHLVLFLPVLIFLAFHSYFPNKQERFILPVVPFFIILGIPGWNRWFAAKQHSETFMNFVKFSWMFFWMVNTIMLPFITTMYSKRARVESMSYLYPKRAGIASVIMEDTNRSSAKMAPEFYLGKWIKTYELSQLSGYDSLEFYLKKYGPPDFPQYVLFLGDKNLVERVAILKDYFPALKLEATIEPGFADKVLYWLNPRNANDVIYVYQTGVPMIRPPD